AGAEGPMGPMGLQGPIGPMGPQGEKGEKGDPGFYVAGSGLSLSGSTFSADTNYLQRRVGSCAPGTVIREVHANGGVTCDPVVDRRFGGVTTIPDGSGGPGASVECFLGQVFLSATSFAPAGTMVADGRLLVISQHQALFSLLGARFGGNGINTFGLPDLQQLAPNGISYVICVEGTYPSRP
ncbi:MAG TPA: tail fiber protein, partial [Vulgatibacter sp.]